MSSPPLADSPLLETMAAIAVEAGRITLAIYQRDFKVQQKADLSPVTEADKASEAHILEQLAHVAPGIPAVAEEATAAAGLVPSTGTEFFLVDPLDGTKEFIARNGEFTVNIALIRRGRPVLGVVYAPVSGTLYVGDVGMCEAWRSRRAGGTEGHGQGPRERIHVRPVPREGVTAVVSRSHATPGTEEYLKQFTIAERVSIGSSLKLCLVAAGEADLYPRIDGPTMEWDIAAGHAVLLAAGGQVLAAGGPLAYGKPGLRNGSIVATGPLQPPSVPA